ncbi:MAG TPA: polysaccharide biosynthesis/export family protein [Myxococcaceae bacterium]|nr:polysaccharide biosynthesis/export family protein [Myxococcaceae bacterium]
MGRAPSSEGTLAEMRPHLHRAFALAVGLAALAGCASTSGSFVWAGDYEEPPLPAQSGYVIQPGDVLQIRVFNQPDMSARARVREDGKVSIPFLNDVVAAGTPPTALAQTLQQRLKEFMNAPVVTISLEEARPFSVAVMGEVTKPGVYPVPQNSGVMQALAAAGGFTQYASRDKIFVLRETPTRARIRFTYEDLGQVQGKAATFRLRAGDTVLVE